MPYVFALFAQAFGRNAARINTMAAPKKQPKTRASANTREDFGDVGFSEAVGPLKILAV